MNREFGYGGISAVTIEHGGVVRSLREWSNALGVPYVTVRMRYKRGKREFSDLFNKSGLQSAMHIQKRENTTTITHQQRSFLDDVLGFDLAQRVRTVAESMEMAPVDVLREFVKHGVEKLERKA